MPIRSRVRPIRPARPKPLPPVPDPMSGPVLVAEDSRTLDRYLACSVCRRVIKPGDRAADRADGGGTVHVAGCARQLPGIVA